MRISRSKMVGLALAGLGVLLALAGLGASFGAHATEAPVRGDQAARTDVDAGGLIADVGVRVDALGIHESPTLHSDPAGMRPVGLPSTHLDRDVGLPVGAPVGVSAHIGLLTGAEARRTTATPGSAGVATQSAALLVGPPATAILAAAAFAGAGIVAYFWAALKRALVIPVVALYAKISRSEVFENEVRERIFAAIKASPGRSASDLAKAAGVAWGTTIYHLDVLEQTRMVTSLREGRHRRYFENGAQLSDTKETVALLCNSVTASVATRVKETPGLTQKDLAEATGMSPQALHWHLNRLVGAGVVRKQREGRVVRHFSG